MRKAEVSRIMSNMSRVVFVSNVWLDFSTIMAAPRLSTDA